MDRTEFMLLMFRETQEQLRVAESRLEILGDWLKMLLVDPAEIDRRIEWYNVIREATGDIARAYREATTEDFDKAYHRAIDEDR